MSYRGGGGYGGGDRYGGRGRGGYGGRGGRGGGRSSGPPTPGPVELQTNYHQMEVKDSVMVFEVRLQFNPEIKMSERRNELVRQSDFAAAMGVADGLWWYSGGDLFVTTVEPKVVSPFEFAVGPEGRQVTITATAGSRQQLASPEARQMLDVLLRQPFESNPDYIRLGRMLYNTNTLQNFLDSLGFLAGHHQSLRNTRTNGQVVNIDTGMCVVTRDVPLETFMRYASQVSRKDMLKGMRIGVTHQRSGRKYTIARGETKRAKNIRFDVDGHVMTLSEYFFKTYKHRVDDEEPCVCVNRARDTYMPVSVCKVLAFQRRKEIDEADDVLAQLIKRTCVSPNDRLADACKVARILGGSEDLQNAGILINPDPIITNGVVLKCPSILHGGARGETSTCAPSYNMRDKAVTAPPGWQPPHKLVYYIDTTMRISEREMDQIISDVDRQFTKTGLEWTKQVTAVQMDVRNHERFEAYAEALPEDAIVFVILQSSSKGNYAKVKDLLDGYVRASQCLNYSKISKGGRISISPQYLANVCLKVNQKCGGYTARLQNAPALFERFHNRILCVGMDVTHPGQGAGRSDAASKAAMVAFDPLLSQGGPMYSKLAKVEGGQEITPEVGQMFRRLLDQLRTLTAPPALVMYLRDGVGESMRDEILQSEASALRAALNDAGLVDSKILFVIATKRHHFRAGRCGHQLQNADAGTVIAGGDVVEDPDRDFFMYSHQPRLGTSKPVLYHVLYNDGACPIAEIQEAVYATAFLHHRSTASTSLPAPVYAAHLLAARANQYLDDTERVEILESMSTAWWM